MSNGSELWGYKFIISNLSNFLSKMEKIDLFSSNPLQSPSHVSVTGDQVQQQTFLALNSNATLPNSVVPGVEDV